MSEQVSNEDFSDTVSLIEIAVLFTTSTNKVKALISATEAFKRGCSNDESGNSPWSYRECTEAYLSAVRRIIDK